MRREICSPTSYHILISTVKGIATGPASRVAPTICRLVLAPVRSVGRFIKWLIMDDLGWLVTSKRGPTPFEHRSPCLAGVLFMKGQ